MAIVQTGNNFNFNDLSAYDSDESGGVTSKSSTGFTFSSPSTGFEITVSGSGMTYGEWGWMGGVATSISFMKNGQLVFSASGGSVDGTVNVYDTGYAGEQAGLYSEFAYWLRDNDVVTGASGNEVLKGYAGDDTLIGGLGDDVLDGGSGAADVALYSGLSSDFEVSKVDAGYRISGVGFGSDTLLNIEFLQFSDKKIAIADALSLPGGVETSPTATYLQQQFNISMEAARGWVMSNIDSPRDIYDICSKNGVTSDMLAEIVQPGFPALTLTGTTVNEWFATQGVPGLL